MRLAAALDAALAASSSDAGFAAAAVPVPSSAGATDGTTHDDPVSITGPCMAQQAQLSFANDPSRAQAGSMTSVHRRSEESERA